MLDGVLPGQGDVEKTETKLPDFIPDDVIHRVASADDVDDLPRGALAHLVTWDEDIALDLLVAGAGITFIDRQTQNDLQGHEDFDADGFGVIEGDELWLPGLETPYLRDEDGWRLPPGDEEE